jgi:hypothetical protein
MTPDEHFTRIGASMDTELFAGVTPADEPQPQIVPDSAALLKASFILRALFAGGLKAPFGLDLAAAEQLWAARLGEFHIEVLEEAIVDWIGAPGSEFPSVGDVEMVARSIVRRRHADSPGERARTAKVCDMCEGLHYVRVVTDVYTIPVGKDMVPTIVQTTAMRPCPTCPEMREKSDLWDRDHFTADHVAKGGCPQCWKYHPTLAHRDKSTSHR